MIEMMCDRDTCGEADCIGNDSSASIVLPSADEFITNLLHLKCKVVQLVRRQMQKEIPEFNGSTYGGAYLRSARRTGALGPRQAPPEVSVESPLRNVKRLPPGEKPLEEKVLPAKVPEHPAKVPELPAKVPELPAENVAVDPGDLHVTDRTGNLRARTENAPNSFVQRLRSTLANCLPFYWIILAIGILGFACLVCGVLLGAFICTNGSNGFPFLFWQRSRVVHAFY